MLYSTLRRIQIHSFLSTHFKTCLFSHTNPLWRVARALVPVDMQKDSVITAWETCKQTSTGDRLAKQVVMPTSLLATSKKNPALLNRWLSATTKQRRTTSRTEMYGGSGWEKTNADRFVAGRRTYISIVHQRPPKSYASRRQGPRHSKLIVDKQNINLQARYVFKRLHGKRGNDAASG